MSDRIPDDLVKRVARAIDPTGFGVGDYPRAVALAALAALAEWADGCLIDPSTWTRIEAKQVGGISCSCPWDENGTPQHRANCAETTRLFTLSPKESQ